MFWILTEREYMPIPPGRLALVQYGHMEGIADLLPLEQKCQNSWNDTRMEQSKTKDHLCAACAREALTDSKEFLILCERSEKALKE